MIIGLDLMSKLEMDLSFSTKRIIWDGISIPMKNRSTVSDTTVVEDLYALIKEAPVLRMSEERHEEIQKLMYEKVDVREYVNTLDDLNMVEKEAMYSLLKKYEGLKVYEGDLGTLNIPPVHFELKPGAKPYHAKPFPIPQAYQNMTRKECKQFEDIGVWEHNLNSEWAAPTFIVPKKTGDVRIVTDFRELNKWIIRKPYPLPKISDLMQKMQKFKYATALDLKRGYYHIPLDEYSQRLCTTILPWGKYSYKRLPMGIATSPDIFQHAMNTIFGDLDYVIAYLDDILILSSEDDTFEDHLKKMDTVLSRCAKMGLKVNLYKSEIMKKELDYLGYTLTQNGIIPQAKKVEAIKRILPPKNKRQLRRFLGMINYYRDMWKRRSHILAPLTKLAGKNAKWLWTGECQKAFDEAIRMVSRETILAYVDFSKPFHIYTDASDYQLGGVIMQDGKPLAFYTRKLNSAQAKYSTGEQELLSIVEILKTFETILLGQRIIIHTDHLNLLYAKQASNRLYRWRMLVEEYGVELEHVAGEKNVVADALSRLDMRPSDYDEQETNFLHTYITEDDIDDERFPMDPKVIAKYQRRDKKLQQDALNNRNKGYDLTNIEGHDIITLHGKVCVPPMLRSRIIV